MTTPRLRFAPAPTGYMHVGSARTALFNWLFAEQTGGELVLRIEDTNAEVNQPGLVEHIIDSLDWLGITFSGDPIHQSQRTSLYDAAIDTLLESQLAYEKDGAVWFAMPSEGATEFDDVIRGRVSFDNAHLKDFVLRRSDGNPTFVVANCVDDIDLKITHVIRGEDMLNITPQALALRQALGESEVPVYAHLPLIVNEQKKKLSKRRDDVSVGDFREQGILPQALVNYLALLGWGPPDNIEVRPIEEIAELFRLENVGGASAVFDTTKLAAINATYIRALSPAKFANALEPWIPQDWSEQAESDHLIELVPLIQERTKLLSEAPGQLEFFFTDKLQIVDAAWDKVTADAQQSKAILELAIAAYEKLEWQTVKKFVVRAKAQLEQMSAELDIKMRFAQLPVRVALTGDTVGPPLFESIWHLGRDETLARLTAALARLDS